MDDIIITDGKVELFIAADNRNQKTIDNKDIFILNFDRESNKINYVYNNEKKYEIHQLNPKDLYIYKSLYDQASFLEKNYEKKNSSNIFYFNRDDKFIFFTHYYDSKSIKIKLDRIQIVKNKKEKIYIRGFNTSNNKLIFLENDSINEIDFNQLLYSDILIEKAEFYKNKKRKNNFLNNEHEFKKTKFDNKKKLEFELDSELDSYQNKKKLFNSKIKIDKYNSQESFSKISEYDKNEKNDYQELSSKVNEKDDNQELLSKVNEKDDNQELLSKVNEKDDNQDYYLK